MDLEIGTALARTASPGVSRDSLDRLDRHISVIHDRIEAGIEEEQFGFAALDLPHTADLEAIEAGIDDLPSGGPVFVLGMGGSALGARTVANALRPDAEMYVLDTLDPRYLTRVFDSVDLCDVTCHVVSKSGETIETRALLETVIEAFAEAGVDWRERTVATTVADSTLGERITDAGVSRLEPPAGVPGRFSVLSSMALPSLALLDIDCAKLLAGGRTASTNVQPSLYETPAYAYAACMAALNWRGVSQNAFVTYREDLYSLAHWFAQLWAESLGKDGMSQTPIPGRGVADHHSQLQRWRGGRRDIAVTTVSVEETVDLTIPDSAGEVLADVSFNQLLSIEREAARAGMAAAGRPTVAFELDRLTPTSLGELFVTLETACIAYGLLVGVDPFDQPAVEWSKRATRQALETGEIPDAIEHEPLRVTSERRS